jgi:hypothetical protein
MPEHILLKINFWLFRLVEADIGVSLQFINSTNVFSAVLHFDKYICFLVASHGCSPCLADCMSNSKSVHCEHNNQEL